MKSLVLLSLFLAHFVSAKVNVDVFPMFHPGPGMHDDPALYEMVMKSQHQLMVFLSENPNSVVFVESLHEELTQDKYFDKNHPEFADRDFFRNAIKVNFPNGVPMLYENFTPNQKTITEDMGLAVNVLFQLGIVKAMYPTNTLEEFNQYVAKNAVDPDTERLLGIAAGLFKAKDEAELARAQELRNEVHTLREKAALRQIQLYSKKDPSLTTVVLAFGANHEFYNYRDNKDYEDLNIRKINLRRYDRKMANLFNNNLNEPRYDTFRFNPQTKMFEIIPGLFSF